MLIYASLTNLGLAASVAVVFVVIYWYGRRKWRVAAARREEVRRLTWLAAEEAERVEAEAAELAYVSPPIVTASLFESSVRVDSVKVGDGMVMQQCAVCYKHTTTRCSRCKAVRYCSGRCQIIHWRQGHKNECHPPKIDDQKNDEESMSSVKGSETNHAITSENHMDIETKDQPKQSKILHAQSTEYISQNTCDYCVNISSSSSSLSSLSDDDFVSDDHQVVHSEEIQNSSNHKILSADPMLNHKTDNDVCESSSVINLSSQDNNEQAVHINKACCGNIVPTEQKSNIDERNMRNSEADSIECSSIDSTNLHKNAIIPPVMSDEVMNNPHKKDAEASCTASSKQISLEAGYENKIHPHKKASSERTTDTNSSYCTAKEKSTDVWLLKAKSAKSALTESSLNTHSSVGGKHFASLNTSSYSNITSCKIDKTPYNFSKSAETKCSTPNEVSEFKTFVRRIPQKLTPSNISKHPSGLRTDVSQKHKILFPYDLFIKLYNCDKVEMHPTGLINCGNSCYANAVLQCLAFTRPLTSYLLKGLHTRICRKEDWCFTCEFESLLKKAKLGQSPLSPALILSHILNNGCSLGHGKEEDAHEFLRYAIDIMQSVCLKEIGTEVLELRAEETTLIQLIFGGYLHSKIKCTKCRGSSERHERMMDLTVEINGNIETLGEALTRFTSTEVLDGENRYQCGRCKSYERAKKKLTILEAPNVLTITLKRFQSGKFGKLNKAVRFPEILNLAPYMHATDDKSPVYSLYAVVVHQDIMNATFSGHYVSYVKSAQGKWYKTDDSRVKPVDLGTVLSKNVYMLFYARCSPRAPILYHTTIQKDPTVSRSFWLSGKSPFQRTDSYSDISSTFSNSDEGSCSTESSTRESCISTDELSDYIRSCSNSENSNVSMHGEDNGLNYGEGLGWGRSRDGSQILNSDMNKNSSNVESRKLTVDCRGSGSDRLSGGKSSSMLIRRVLPTSKEGRVQIFY